MMKVVKNKAAMQAILAADSEGIKKIASSGSAYENVEKTAKNMFNKYIDKIVADKKIAESLKNNQKLHALQRVFTQGTNMLVLSAVAPVDKWKDNEKAILETLGTFVISEPKKENAPAESK